MATTANTIFSRMLKTLRENNNIKEKREALTYISSQAKKLEASGTIKEERYKELCRLVVEAFTKDEGSMQYEAFAALNAIVQEFKAHSLHLFESMLQTDKRTRLKILKLLEVVEDNAISAAANDGQALNFFKDSMHSVQPTSMEWITPTACIDNLHMLTKIEQQALSDEQKLDEDIYNHSLALLRRLYKIAAITVDQNIQRFDNLLMDKIVTLAYMGHKRQRNPAIKVLQQAVATNSSARIRKDYSDLWLQYKTNLQSIYCKRMLLLVTACEPDWSVQWNTTIQFLGTDLHRGASLINNLLSVEEKAFKSTDPIIRRQAFLSWKLLIDNFALDHQELATPRRIKLLCIPLNAKNSKTEMIALTKLEVWWHLIIKLYKDIAKFVAPVMTQFLNYCFGPLGDTPLLSSKFDVVASPAKRFFKTKVVAVDALYQLIVAKEELYSFAPMLEERLPHPITDAVFQECSKSIIHSVGEALLILGQLTDQEMRNRFQLGKILWTNLMIYIKNIKLNTKDHLYKDVILVITELGNHIDKLMVKDMICNVILPDITHIIKKIEFHDNVLPKLVLKLLSSPVLDEISKDRSCNEDIKCLLGWCISSQLTYPSGVLGFLEKIMENLQSANDAQKNMMIHVELWPTIAEVLMKYLKNIHKTNGNDEYNIKTVKSVLSFPFQYTCPTSFEETQSQVTAWKDLYKQFESQSDVLSTIKPNEILLDTVTMMRDSLNANKNCCSLIVNCLDTLLSTINFEHLLAQDETPVIVQLILDAATYCINTGQNLNSEIALKSLSTMLITTYRQNPQKVTSCLNDCKSVIELALASQTKALFKEIASTWEVIVSIFKGLNRQLNHKVLSSYKDSIVLAMDHPSPDIKSLAQSIFEVKDSLDGSAKRILSEIEETLEKSKSKSDSSTKKKTETGQTKEVRIAGSFLSRKSPNAKPIFKPPEKNEKNTLVLPEPDSQDYVFIKTDLKFDVNRLTEHQKETLKKKREDIPALYNDLSQSSSQNSQNLQQWFDIKTKHINESEKVSSKKNDSSVTQKPVDNEANKENKIAIKQTAFSDVVDHKIVDHMYCSKLDENTAGIKQDDNLTDEVEKENSDDKQEDDVPKDTNLTPHTMSLNEQNDAPHENEDTNIENPASVVKKLNFESREEFPEDRTHEQQLSPSMLDNVKRRHRNSSSKLSSPSKSDKTVEGQTEPITTNAQRTLRVKATQGKSDTSDKRKPNDDTDFKEGSSENKKSMKRKYMSDIESDQVMQRRKRKLISSNKNLNDDDGETSRGSNVFSDIDMDSISQRTRNEISRLKIDMVFDCHSVNRRRAKHSDENEKEASVHALRKHGTPDTKSVKLKSADVKSAEGSKRFSKTTEKSTKDARDVDDADQGTFKRRSSSRKNMKPEFDNADVNKEARKFSNFTDKASELKNSADAETIHPTSVQAVQDAAVTKVQVDEKDKVDKDDFKYNSSAESSELTEPSKQSQDEVGDVVESSQTSTIGLKLDKKCGEKQCFIKINKMTNVHATKVSDTVVEKHNVPESTPMDYGDNDVPDPCDRAKNNAEMDEMEENKDNANKTSVQETDNSDIKVVIPPDNQKMIDNSSSMKSVGIINFTSPKSSTKMSKSKPFTGRAAHMLGLVTKQSRIDDDSPIIEDELPAKKLKTKDAESETSTSKKISMVKEIDKIGGPSGSRQEKMFSNMRSADYCASSSHAFTTLKNDGEKLSFKSDKSMSDHLSMEASTDKENERSVSPLRERDHLPILEWSSANPPSLTASPSASILKRCRSNMSEPDSDSTPNKRKRVSFADPPVKEIFFDNSVSESPQKPNKCPTVRGPTSRKDSPLRLKQAKFKYPPIDVEKVLIDNDTQNQNDTEAVSNTEESTEKRDESLTKISEASSETLNINEQTHNDHLENNNVVESDLRARINIDEDLGLAQEIEISMDSSASAEDQQVLPSGEVENSIDTVLIDCIGTVDSETQQDIFDGADTKNNVTLLETNNYDINRSIQNNSVDSIKLNVTNDSVIEALPTRGDNVTSLEDTVDIQNMTELNSTMNSDEIFCGKFMRTSTGTHGTGNTAEQDTLTVTDSVFASLPLSQDTQEAEENVEPDYEFLDSTQPIYPTLSSCVEPIDTIIEQLTYPPWKQNLRTYFTTTSLCTIGDLAQLSEREVNRLPMKCKSKTKFVKKVLQHFESVQIKRLDETSDTKVEQPPAVTMDETQTASAAPVSVIIDESLSCSTPLNQSTVVKILDNPPEEKSPTEHLDKTDSIVSDMNISSEHVYSKNPDLLADISGGNEEEDARVSVATRNPPGTSTDETKPTSTSPLFSKTDATASKSASSSASINASESLAEASSTYEELHITHSSVGTSTEDDSFVTPSVQKVTKSVESQMALDELLDEIDVNLVLKSAVRRCSPETLLTQYKIKMSHLKETELIKETIRLLGLQNNKVNDTSLKAACYACGINKVLTRLPDIFSHDKQFFNKVLKVYSKKLNITDCLNVFNYNQLKSAICQMCSSSQLVEILSEKLKQEEQQGIKQPMTELSSLDAMLQRLPMDVIISHTVANEELIPAPVVLDIALQNNSSDDIARALNAQSPFMAKSVMDKLWTSQFTVAHIENGDVPKDSLLSIFKSVCSKLTAEELLDAYHEAMTSKLKLKEEKK
ncbi:telomere-associated protein RIF1 isoform X2 [Ooceraea biroi]|uniref:telomere-associated protein RIF1 isoform X2 n=1 Tax=Ooceraea biroi TaxID=2015173 RepID=UPI000F07832D|nr:telomere-associated protein RIF1 isoform X2 [Ooceraea biroi]